MFAIDTVDVVVGNGDNTATIQLNSAVGYYSGAMIAGHCHTKLNHTSELLARLETIQAWGLFYNNNIVSKRNN